MNKGLSLSQGFTPCDVRIPPNSHVEIQSPQSDGIRRGALGEPHPQEPYKGTPGELSHLLPPHVRIRELSHLHLEEALAPQPAPYLGLPAPRTVRSKCLLCVCPPVCGLLLEQPEWTQPCPPQGFVKWLRRFLGGRGGHCPQLCPHPQHSHW